MSLLQWIEGRTVEEASAPAELPSPCPPPGGGGRTPYPDYQVMSPDKWRYDWDEKTRRLVRDRIRNIPPRSFFSEDEFALLQAVCDRALPQEDRPAPLRIPIAPFIDQRLAQGGSSGSGYRYEDMPWDPEAYRLGLRGIDQAAQNLFAGKRFTDLDESQQDQVLAAVEKGDPPGEAWQPVKAARFFKILMHDVVDMYYSHPAAWNEIGFQGPASPRGHVRLSLGKRDPWEAEETRPLPLDERRAAAPHGRHGAPMGRGGAGP
jgi:hypothetical protein